MVDVNAASLHDDDASVNDNDNDNDNGNDDDDDDDDNDDDDYDPYLDDDVPVDRAPAMTRSKKMERAPATRLTRTNRASTTRSVPRDAAPEIRLTMAEKTPTTEPLQGILHPQRG